MPRFSSNSNLYGWDAPETQLRSVRRACVLLTAVSLALSVVCGILPTGVARHNWVGFAGTASLVALMLMIIAVIRFSMAKSHLDYRTFHSIHWMMDYAPLFHAMLMTVALIAGIVSCFQAFTGALDVLALLLFLAAAVSSLLMRKTYRSLHTYTMKEQDS